MTKTPKFLVGEPVERITDGLVGKVVEISTYNGDFSYKVDLEREDDDKWWGTETAWRSARRVHAHVVQNSRDCDGDYEHTHVDRPSAIERTAEFGDLDFKARVMAYIVSFHVNGLLSVTPDGLLWNQDTEEGYTRTVVNWCEDEACSDRRTQRDFRAESMGY